jgi:hypothetical protein
MAEVVNNYVDADKVLRSRVRTRNALGDWEWLIDGETGKPVQIVLADSYVESLHNPREVLTHLGEHMRRIADKASILERRIW